MSQVLFIIQYRLCNTSYGYLIMAIYPVILTIRNTPELSKMIEELDEYYRHVQCQRLSRTAIIERAIKTLYYEKFEKKVVKGV